jgi:hypothetical protein
MNEGPGDQDFLNRRRYRAVGGHCRPAAERQRGGRSEQSGDATRRKAGKLA